MTEKTIALYRDKAIIELIQKHGPLTAEQIYLLMFAHIRGGDAKARDRLHKLAEKGRIKRGRLLGNAFIYWDGEMHPLWDHKVLANEFYVRLVKDKKSWMQIGEMSREENCGSIVVDIYLTVRLTLNGPWTKYFIEADKNADIGRPQKKLTDLAKLYHSDIWHGAYWAQTDDPQTATFPRVIMVVPEERRRDNLSRFAEKHMPREMRIKIASMEDIKKDVVSLL